MSHTTQSLVEEVFVRLAATGTSYRFLQNQDIISKDTLSSWRRSGGPSRLTAPLQRVCRYFDIDTTSYTKRQRSPGHARAARAFERLADLPRTKAEAVASLLEAVAVLIDAADHTTRSDDVSKT